MLKLYRANQPYTLPLLFVTLLVLRIVTFYSYPETPTYNGGLFSDLIYALIGKSELILQIIALILVFLQAFIVNRVANEYNLQPETTYLTALFYILLASFSPAMHSLSPALIGNTFFIIAFIELLRSYKNAQSADLIFNIGFWIAIASLCYQSYWVFIIFGIIGIIKLRTLRIEEILILLSGFAVPYVLLFVYYFWVDGLVGFTKNNILAHFDFLGFRIENIWQNYLSLGVWLLALLTVLLNSGTFFEKAGIYTQRNTTLLFYLLLVAGLSFFTQSKLGMTHLYLFIIPLSIFLAHTFLAIRKPSHAEFAFITILLVTIVFHYIDPILETLAK